jgi:diguanylate cyclase (GGDEF)-like protein
MIRDASGTPLFIQGVMTDITPTKEAELRMQHLAYHDPLTGLPNRAMFEQHLGLALARARRDDLGVAVLFLDLDAFKPVNDTHGHATGDEVLRQMAARLRSAVRETDLVARQGGDEFLVLIADLPIGSDAQDAWAAVAKVTERMTEVLAEPFRLRVGELTLRSSIGCGLYPVDATEAPALLRHADQAMYEHKRNRPARPTPLRRLA